ncbi:B-cell antigen receptor complex-associated protein alpha chain [Cyclopterus lumpus]|uniref:CD79a molecule, immunoglobulin-associated alpha n=1 Tax=Cyclopterus lumpus TaxID=8103 RepID=A0A8C2ZMR5_CYCLU|nr:B-cell antigen receptor complex-associated protein alpha chain [Cyclopterus lumpus]
METITNVLLCSFVVAIAQSKVILEPDRPFFRVQVYHTAELKCCYSPSKNSVKFSWIKQAAKRTQGKYEFKLPEHASQGNITVSGKSCGALTFEPVQLNDSGFYQCWLKGSKFNLFSHGTYLQVYKPMEKTINLSESTKNKILTAEGFLLILCVIVPSLTLLFKSKRLNELEKKKAKKEEENIYQGLNLDDCWSTYDQIERSQAHGPYQDVGNFKEEEEQIQLEKP